MQIGKICPSVDFMNELPPGHTSPFRACVVLLQEYTQTHSKKTAIPNNRELKKMEIQFFLSKTCFVVTYEVTNVLPKLVDILLFLQKKNMNFHFF